MDEEHDVTNEERRDLVRSIPAYVWSALPDGTVDFVNPQWKQYTGLPSNAAFAWKWQSVVHPEDIEKFTSVWKQALQSVEPFDQEVRVQRHDGSYRWWLVRCAPQLNENREVLKWYGSGFDIDDRKRLEDELCRKNETNRDSVEQELRELIDTIPVICGRFSLDGSVDFFNQRTLEYYGLTSEEMIGFNWINWLHPDDLPWLLPVLADAFAHGRPIDIETRNRRADGEYRWLMCRMVPQRNEHGKIVKWFGTSFDIEDRKRAEQAVLEQRVIERTRVARELHDTVMQSFHAALLMLGTATNLLEPGSTRDRFEESLNEAQQALIQGREAIQELRLGKEEPDNLVAALSSLGHRLANACVTDGQTTFHVEVSGVPVSLHHSANHEVFSIGSEALRNAFHHASAKNVHLQFRYAAEQFYLTVLDDGRGIDPGILRDAPREGHYGLAGMRERAKVAKGDLNLSSELGLGAKIELRVPAMYAYLF